MDDLDEWSTDDHDERHDADPEIRNEDDDDWDNQIGCCCPDKCLFVGGEHRHGECSTAETVKQYEQSVAEAEDVCPQSANPRLS